jgi:peptide/nickel transport system substrate-binding protein
MHAKQRRLTSRTGFALGAGLVTAVLVLTGCGTPAEPAPIEGGSITVATAQINSLDPQGASAASTGTGTVAKAVFSTLVKNSGGQFVADLATEWLSSDDGTEWTFTLDEDAVFSDGTPVTADDVVASLERLRSEGGPNAGLFAGVSSIEAVSDGELALTTSTGGSLLFSLTLLYVAPADRLADPGFWDQPIGSGPFVVESYAAGDSVTLVRNEEYWGEPAILDEVRFVNIPEVSSQVTALETGDVDIVVNLPQDQIPVVDGGGLATVERSDALSVMSLWFNHSREPFDDIDVRRAMWLAVDWNQLREDLYGDIASPATAPVASGVFGWSEQEPYPYDADAARELLEGAGLGDGFEVEFKFNPGSFSQLQSLLEAAATYWAEVGVTVNLVPQEQAVYAQDLSALNWDMTQVNNSSRTGDADQILGRLYTTKANRLGFANADVDRLVAEAAASADQDERLAAYAEVDEILWSEVAGIWPMEVRSVYGVTTRVTGFVPEPAGQPVFTLVGVTSE